MSRVFAADDLALGRTVAIRVLHPELAADVNAERFSQQNTDSEPLRHVVRESRGALKHLASDGHVRAQLANPR